MFNTRLRWGFEQIGRRTVEEKENSNSAHFFKRFSFDQPNFQPLKISRAFLAASSFATDLLLAVLLLNALPSTAKKGNVSEYEAH